MRYIVAALFMFLLIEISVGSAQSRFEDSESLKLAENYLAVVANYSPANANEFAKKVAKFKFATDRKPTQEELAARVEEIKLFDWTREFQIDATRSKVEKLPAGIAVTIFGTIRDKIGNYAPVSQEYKFVCWINEKNVVGEKSELEIAALEGGPETEHKSLSVLGNSSESEKLVGRIVLRYTYDLRKSMEFAEAVRNDLAAAKQERMRLQQDVKELRERVLALEGTAK